MKIKLLEMLKNGISSVCAKYINEKNEIEYLPIFYIAGSQTLPPPLPPEEEQELIEKLSQEDNLEIRQKFYINLSRKKVRPLHSCDTV